MIELEQVQKRYDDGHVALKDVNLSFKEGEITAIIGPSGCGKTTTMKLINRLINPSKGKITIQGEDISRMDPVTLRRRIGYVIQNIGLFPHMTIAKNVAVVPNLLKWDKAKIDRRVNELLELVGLPPETYANRYPSELSGGQQQRVGVIRALAADPDIILMDEPFSALDPISREQLQDELIRLQQDLKKTIVFVTHDMDEAIKIADTIVLMKEGEVVQVGKPEYILRHPANEFVENFIGKKRLQNGPDYVPPTVDEVMVDQPVVLYPNRGLAEAIKTLEKKRVDTVLVVDRSQKLLGSASIYHLIEHYGEEGKTLADVMKPVAHTVSPGTPLPEALAIMSEHHLSNLAVVSEDNKFIGLITRGSIVRHLAEVYPPVQSGGYAYV